MPVPSECQPEMSENRGRRSIRDLLGANREADMTVPKAQPKGESSTPRPGADKAAGGTAQLRLRSRDAR